MIAIVREVVRRLWAFQLDTNLPSILPRLSNNLPYAQRSYAGFSDFHSKKVKKISSDNAAEIASHVALKVNKSEKWEEKKDDFSSGGVMNNEKNRAKTQIFIQNYNGEREDGRKK